MYHLTRKVWEKIIKFSEDGVKFDTKAMIVNVSSLVQTLQDSPWRCYKNSEHAELSHHETFVSECSLSQMEGPPLQIDPSTVSPVCSHTLWDSALGGNVWTECCDVVESHGPTQITSFLSWSVKWPFIEPSFLFLKPNIHCKKLMHKIDGYV